MKMINILATLLKEQGCKIYIKYHKNYINFRPSSNKIKDFRLIIEEDMISIVRIYTRAKSYSGRVYFVPENKEELSVNIYNPKSLNIIRNWFQTL